MAKMKSSKRAAAATAPAGARPVSQRTTGAAPARPRKLRLPAPQLLRFKRVKHPVQLPSAWQVSRKTCQLLWKRRWVFLGIFAIYALLSTVFVSGMNATSDITSLKQDLAQTLGGSAGQIVAGVGIYTTLLTSDGSPQSASAGAYQVFLGLIFSLVFIWALRQANAGESFPFKDVFYKSMYPFVPFILVLVIVLLQMLPLLLGGGIYDMVVSYGIASTLLQKLLWGLPFLAGAVVSAYWLTASLFALYIVTLPDMTPLQALRNAKQLVYYRRGSIFRKLLFLPLAIFVLGTLILVPVIIVATAASQWAFFAIAMLALLVAHAYMYTLYRELLA